MEEKLQILFDFSRDREILLAAEHEADSDHRFSGVYLDKVSQLLYFMKQRSETWTLGEDSFKTMAGIYSCLRSLFREGQILREMALELEKNKTESRYFSELTERSRERLDFLHEKWNENFPTGEKAGEEIGDLAFFAEVLLAHLDEPEENLLQGNEMKFLCLLRNLFGLKKDFGLNVWQEVCKVLLSAHMIDFMCHHAESKDVQTFVFLLSGFAHDQFKLGFFYYTEGARKLYRQLEERQKIAEGRDEALEVLLQDFLQRL